MPCTAQKMCCLKKFTQNDDCMSTDHGGPVFISNRRFYTFLVVERQSYVTVSFT